MFLAKLLFLLFLYTDNECLICGWPYKARANSAGKCYLEGGMQSGLDQGCYVWCDAWARESGVPQTATPVLYSWHDAGGAICRCQRLERNSEVGYTTRPSASCDFGYSDAVQGYYDSIAVAQRETKIQEANTVLQKVDLPSFSNLHDAIIQYENLIKQNTGGYISCGQNGPDRMYGLALQYWNENYETFYHTTPLPPGMTCQDFAVMPVLAKMEFVMDDLKSKDTAIIRLDEALKTVMSQTSANQSALMQELGLIKSKPVGGGSANLDPVLNAINSLRESQAIHLSAIDSGFSSSIETLQSSLEDNFKKILDSSLSGIGRDSGNNGTSIDLSGVETRIDSTNSKLSTGFKNVMDSLSMLGGKFGRLDTSLSKIDSSILKMDSFNRAIYDKQRLEDSLSYNKVMDSLGPDPTAKAQVEQGIQDAQGFAIQGESNAQGLKNALSGWQNLPGTCVDAPVWEFDLQNIGKVQIDMNAYPWIVKFSRFGMRFFGILASMLIVFKALELLGYNNAKKD